MRLLIEVKDKFNLQAGHLSFHVMSEKTGQWSPNIESIIVFFNFLCYKVSNCIKDKLSFL